jgi:hypothetical protein
VSDPTTWFQPRMVGIKASATALLPTDALDFELVSCLEPRIGLLGVDAQRDRRWLSSGFAASYAATTALAAINPWSWGLPILLVSARPLDEYKQHRGKFPVASNRGGVAAWQNHQPVHARHARWDVDCRPVNGDIRGFGRGSLRAVDQWPHGSDDPDHHRTTLDA